MELLIVIIIVGIAAGFILRSYYRQLGSSSKSGCQCSGCACESCCSESDPKNLTAE